MKKLQQLLVCSLLFNLVFCVLASTLVYRRGGISYLIESVASSRQVSAPPIKYIDSPRYLGIKSTYTKLPRKEAAIIFAGDSLISTGDQIFFADSVADLDIQTLR